MERLTDLPNIGNQIADLLQKVEIDTPEKLKLMGSERAFRMIRSIHPEACFNMLCALEGAIQHVRWHDLSPQVKNYLRQVITLDEIV